MNHKHCSTCLFHFLLSLVCYSMSSKVKLELLEAVSKHFSSFCLFFGGKTYGTHFSTDNNSLYYSHQFVFIEFDGAE